MPTPKEAFVNTVERQAFGGERLRPANFSEGAETLGRAVQGFGDDLKTVAKNIDEIHKKDAEVAAQQRDTDRVKARINALYGPEGFYSKKGVHAMEARKTLEEKLKKIDDEYGKDLNPRARTMYNTVGAQRNADELPKAWEYANKEAVKHENVVAESAIEAATQLGAASLDPVLIDKSLADVARLSREKAIRDGYGDATTQDLLVKTAVGKAVQSVANAMELKSPGAAQQFVATKAHLMDPDDVSALLDKLAKPAAQEAAGSDISNFLVVLGQASEAPAAPNGVSPPSGGGGAGPTPIPPPAALEAAQFTGPNAQEGAPTHTDSRGRLIESPRGALGITQVMRATGYSPGYGVKPLQNQSREEYLRFGRDYMAAMMKEYDNNIVLALTAYNWGPGNVDAHLKKVGDPRKGGISDAAFLASIPGKEAREYAAKVLHKAGSYVSGAPGPSNGQPVPVGQEIDLDATINNIRNSDRTFAQKEALIAEATRLHGYGRQVKAEREEQQEDAVWAHINTLPPNSFTNFDSLPLNLRRGMDPQFERRIRDHAEANKKALAGEREDQTELELHTLYLDKPQEFNGLDIRKRFPGLSTSKIMEWRERQHKSRESAANPADIRTVDHDRVRSLVKTYTGRFANIKDLSPAFDTSLRKAEAWLEANPGKTIPDTVLDGIVRDAMQPVTVVREGGSSRVVPKALVPRERERSNKPVSHYRIESRAAVRAELQQLLGRTPSEEEITRVVNERKGAGVYR